MSEAAPAPEGRAQAQTGSAQRKAKAGLSPKLVATLGGALTALAVGTVIATSVIAPSPSNGSQLFMVAQSDITDAASTLSSQGAAPIVDNAKRCTVPMGNLVLSRSGAGQSGLIRIRSGGYLSPPFALTEMPQRIAIPYPADYSAGKGQIYIEGSADNAVVSLAPTVTIPKQSGSTPISVWWTPRKPC